MEKYLRLIAAFLFWAAVPCFAAPVDRMEIQLHQEYGNDLTHVPFFLKYAYEKEFDKKWAATFYEDRKSFLQDYTKRSAAEKAKLAAEAKDAAENEKRRLADDKAYAEMVKERKKKDKDEEDAEEKEEAQEKKDFDDAIAQQKRDLKDIKQEFFDEQSTQR